MDSSKADTDNDDACKASVSSTPTKKQKRKKTRTKKKVKLMKTENNNNNESNNNENNDSPFVYNSSKLCKTKNRPIIYDIKFFPFDKNRNIFAVTEKSRVRIYECQEGNAKESFKLLMEFVDENEYFYSLAWTVVTKPNSGSSYPLLAAAGKLGVVRLFHIPIVNDQLKENSMLGHSGAINELQFGILNPHLLITASEDRSVRLWNCYTNREIAMFAGIMHSDQVVTLSWNPSETMIVSGGLDNRLIIWRADSDEIKNSIDESNSVVEENRHAFETKRIYEADFSTNAVHWDYVDSVIWIKDNCFLSKSSKCEVCMWKIGKLEEENLNLKSTTVTELACVIVESLKELWFVKMQARHSSPHYIALGDSEGRILFWDLKKQNFDDASKSLVTSDISKTLIRTVSFSPDGKILLAGNDNGDILRYELKVPK